MNTLFRKIDWSLSVARIIVAVSHIFIALFIIAYSIFSFTQQRAMTGMCVLSVGLFAVCISVVFWLVLSSYLKDVKLIRNKLYGVSVKDIAAEYKIKVIETDAQNSAANGGTNGSDRA